MKDTLKSIQNLINTSQLLREEEYKSIKNLLH